MNMGNIAMQYLMNKGQPTEHRTYCNAVAYEQGTNQEHRTYCNAVAYEQGTLQ